MLGVLPCGTLNHFAKDLNIPTNNAHFFIPVYHDTESFLILREKVKEALPAPYRAHFHLVDDSAGEDQDLQALKAQPDVSLVPMPYNLGHQRALVHGLREFLSDTHEAGLIITMDADGEDRPEDLPALLAAYLEDESAKPIVLARRTRRNETVFFKTLYFLYRKVFRFLTGTFIQTGNFALYHTSIARRILFHPYFDLSYASTLFALGSRLIFVPCPRGSRYRGRSKMNFSRLAIHGVRMLMPFMDRIAMRGVVAFALVTALSLLSSVALAFVHVTDIYRVPNWVLVSSVLVFVLGFLSVCNFAILMTIFANVQGIAMSRIATGNERT